MTHTDEKDETPSRGDALQDQNTTIFLSLFLILLAFFVMLNSIATRDPSKVEAAVSSLTETFAKSKLIADAGTLSAKSGSLVYDKAFFDNIHAILQARRAWAGAKISTGDGYLTAYFRREALFLTRTGVPKPAAAKLAGELASAMARQSSGTAVRSMEIRVIATPAEMVSATAQIPLPVRQAAGFANIAVKNGVAPETIGIGLKPGNSALFELTFYSRAPASIGYGDG